MFRRIVNAWPYALAVVIGFLSWYGFRLVVNATPEGAQYSLKGYGLLLIYVGYPFCLLLGATILGFRRGYDWVTLLVCLGIYLVWPAVAEALTTRDWRSYATNWGMATLIFFVPATQIGVLVGLALRRRRQAKRQEPSSRLNEVVAV